MIVKLWGMSYQLLKKMKNVYFLFFKTLFWVSIATISKNRRQNPEIYKIVDNILVRIVIFIIEWWHEGVISNHVLFNSNFKTFNQVLIFKIYHLSKFILTEY